MSPGLSRQSTPLLLLTGVGISCLPVPSGHVRSSIVAGPAEHPPDRGNVERSSRPPPCRGLPPTLPFRIGPGRSHPTNRHRPEWQQMQLGRYPVGAQGLCSKRRKPRVCDGSPDRLSGRTGGQGAQQFRSWCASYPGLSRPLRPGTRAAGSAGRWMPGHWPSNSGLL